MFLFWYTDAMRKKIFFLWMTLALLAVPFHAKARTAQEILSLIAQLEAQIVQLKQELSLIGQEPTPSALPFSATLKREDRHQEVSKLQEILQSEGLFCKGCKPTGYFGYWTKAGLMNFQQKYLLPITGIVDEATRIKLNQLAQASLPAPASLSTPQNSPTPLPKDTTLPSVNITINGGAQSTMNPDVLLALSCSDSEKIEGVRYSHTGTFTNELWMGFSSGYRWRLSGGDGLKTVYFQCKDRAGNIAQASDTIILDTTPPSRSATHTSSALPGKTAQATLSLATGEAATCKYAQLSNKGYDMMSPFPQTLATSHSLDVALESEGTHSFYVKCRDMLGNVNQDDLEISFQVGSPTDTSYNINVLVVKYFPLTDDKYFTDEKLTGIQETFSSAWQKTIDITQDLEANIEKATSSLQYAVTDIKIHEEPLPVELEGKPDYRSILLKENICEYVNNQNVQEVWLFAYGNISESAMASAYENSYDLPLCSKTYRIYGFDYAKGTAEAFFTWTKQLEAELGYVDAHLLELWQGPENPQKKRAIARCGSASYPPNSRHEEDYANTIAQESDCLAWNPDSIGPRMHISCAHWECQKLDYLIWNLQNLPGRLNTKTYKSKPLRNWWDVHGDFDNVMSTSRTLLLE